MKHPMEPRGGFKRRTVTASVLVAALLAALLSFVPGVAPAAAEETVSKQGTLGDGYFFVATDGGIFNFGDSEFKGSTGDIKLNKPIVGAETTPTGEGYWLVASDGGIFTFGDAKFLGSTGDIVLNKPIVAMVATPTGNGYWLFATDGGVFSFGDAKFFGSTGDIVLNKPIVGADATPTGNGYYMVASDGGIFTFGDAEFFGSAGDIKLNKPIVGMAALDDGDGYYLVATDGGIFSYGRTADDAQFFGSTGAMTLNQPIVGMDLTASNQGYYLVAADGGIFSFGDAEFLGSTGAIALNKPIVGMRVTPNSPVEAPDFIVDLRGSKEVPGPGDEDGNGFALIDLTDDEVCYNLKVNVIDQATAAHIHEAPAGQAGPVVITLQTPDQNGTAEACQAVDPALAADIFANPQYYYVNVHNEAFKGGAVRGQLEGEILAASTADGTAFTFDSEFAENIEEAGQISGIGTGETVVGGDIRPATGEIYIVTKLGGDLRLYELDGALVATLVGAPFASTGTSYGVDFNPVVDRLRIVSDTDENFRVHPDTGVVIVDSNPTGGPAPLRYAVGDPSFGIDPNIVAAAYTNNFDQLALDPKPGTELYVIDSNLNTLAEQTDPNGGVLGTVGPLGINIVDVVSFDIAPAPQGEPGTALLVARVDGATVTQVFAINLATGDTTLLGTVGDGSQVVTATSAF